MFLCVSSHVNTLTQDCILAFSLFHSKSLQSHLYVMEHVNISIYVSRVVLFNISQGFSWRWFRAANTSVTQSPVCVQLWF